MLKSYLTKVVLVLELELLLHTAHTQHTQHTHNKNYFFLLNSVAAVCCDLAAGWCSTKIELTIPTLYVVVSKGARLAFVRCWNGTDFGRARTETTLLAPHTRKQKSFLLA